MNSSSLRVNGCVWLVIKPLAVTSKLTVPSKAPTTIVVYQRRNAGEYQHQPIISREARTLNSAKSGVSGGSAKAKGINAPNAPIKKTVFFIDNINPRYSVDDVVNFVSDLHVNIVFCFEVQPRKRYSDDGDNPIPRRAFRLCIHSDDCDFLLDANKWPARVSIYNYFFKEKNTANSYEREQWQDKDRDKPVDAHLLTRGVGCSASKDRTASYFIFSSVLSRCIFFVGTCGYRQWRP
jgi:hypothetical protein